MQASLHKIEKVIVALQKELEIVSNKETIKSLLEDTWTLHNRLTKYLNNKDIRYVRKKRKIKKRR